jgi:hypothetical protein
VLVTELDPLFPARRAGADPGRLDAFLDELSLTAEAAAATAPAAVIAPCRLATRVFGIRLDQQPAANPVLAAPVTPNVPTANASALSLRHASPTPPSRRPPVPRRRECSSLR